MHYKITIESNEAGNVRASINAKGIGFSERVSALLAMFDALGIKQEHFEIFAVAASILADNRTQETVKIDMDEMKKQMGEADE